MYIYSENISELEKLNAIYVKFNYLRKHSNYFNV